MVDQGKVFCEPVAWDGMVDETSIRVSPVYLKGVTVGGAACSSVTIGSVRQHAQPSGKLNELHTRRRTVTRWV